MNVIMDSGMRIPKHFQLSLSLSLSHTHTHSLSLSAISVPALIIFFGPFLEGEKADFLMFT
jgi:hypothetical protein